MTPIKMRPDKFTTRDDSPAKSILKSKLSIGASTMKTANFLEL
jgi:hypothetical protein